MSVIFFSNTWGFLLNSKGNKEKKELSGNWNLKPDSVKVFFLLIKSALAIIVAIVSCCYQIRNLLRYFKEMAYEISRVQLKKKWNLESNQEKNLLNFQGVSHTSEEFPNLCFGWT